MRRIVHRHGENEIERIVTYYENRPRRDVLSGYDTMEIDERESPLHGEAKATIVGMVRVGAAIPVAQQSVDTERVIVWPFRHGRDRQGYLLKQARFEDALGSHQRNPCPIEDEALGQEASRQDIAMGRDLFGKPLECCRSYAGIAKSVEH